MKDFYDEDEIRNVYYPEMVELIKAESGAKRVVVFDHTLRTADDELREAKKIREVVRRAHNDYTEWSGPQRVRDILPDEAEDLLTRRFAIIQVWRPIRHPVETFPLAICDARSVAFEDFIISERLYQDRKGQTYACAYNPKHHWYWFPRMRREEALVFKVYDSQKEGVARWTAHTAFEDPTTPPNARPRESIEIRTLAFFYGDSSPRLGIAHATVATAIDCDVHPAVPNLKALLPHFDEYWRNSIVERGIPGFETNSYPPKVPISVRQDWSGNERQRRDRRDGSCPRRCSTGSARGTAILNCLYGAHLPYSEDMGVAVARAVNNYIAKEWLDRDPRLRASIVMPTQNIEYAVDEVERVAPDKRFVQIQLVTNAGDAARAPALVAAVRRRREARPADRHPSGLRLPAVDDLARLADLLRRGLRGLRAGVPVAARQPDLRGRLRQIPQAQGGAAGIGRHLAARLPVAAVEILARRALGGALGGPAAEGDRARPCAADNPAVRRPG